MESFEWVVNCLFIAGNCPHCPDMQRKCLAIFFRRRKVSTQNICKLSLRKHLDRFGDAGLQSSGEDRQTGRESDAAGLQRGGGDAAGDTTAEGLQVESEL